MVKVAQNILALLLIISISTPISAVIASDDTFEGLTDGQELELATQQCLEQFQGGAAAPSRSQTPADPQDVKFAGEVTGVPNLGIGITGGNVKIEEIISDPKDKLGMGHTVTVT